MVPSRFTNTGRGASRTRRADQPAAYGEAPYRETQPREGTLTCAPAWEASNFRTHNYDPWAAFRATSCPIRILRAEIGSTARLDEGLSELKATGRVRVDLIPETSHFLPMERPDLVREALAAVAAG